MPADTKAKLLETAERLARSRGYNGFSYADLAAEIGIRTASIHYHFRMKADLAQAMLARYTARVQASLEHLAAQSNTGAQRLLGFVRVYRDALADGSSLCLCVSLSADADSLETPVREHLRAFHEQTIAWLSHAFADGAADGSVQTVNTPADEAAATLALVEGAQLLARAARNVAPFDAATAALRARL